MKSMNEMCVCEYMLFVCCMSWYWIVSSVEFYSLIFIRLDFIEWYNIMYMELTQYNTQWKGTRLHLWTILRTTYLLVMAIILRWWWWWWFFVFDEEVAIAADRSRSRWKIKYERGIFWREAIKRGVQSSLITQDSWLDTILPPGVFLRTYDVIQFMEFQY